jgi:hypothetical protein
MFCGIRVSSIDRFQRTLFNWKTAFFSFTLASRDSWRETRVGKLSVIPSEEED